MAPAPADGEAVPPAVTRYVLTWTALAFVVVAAVGLWLGLDGVSVPLFVGLVVLTGGMDAFQLVVHHEEADEAISLVEVGIVVSILLLPGFWALLAIATAVFVNQVAIKRREVFKATFNTAQHVVSSAVAIMAVAPLGPAPPVTVELLLRVGVALGLYGVVSSLAFTGLFRRLGNEEGATVVVSGLPFDPTTVFGSGAVGLLGYVLYVAEPLALPLLLVPLGAMRVAYREFIRTKRLLVDVRQERNRLDRVVVGASDGIVLLDRDGAIELWNPAMEAVTGYEAQEVVGTAATERLLGKAADGAHVDPLEPLRTGTGATVEVVLDGANRTQAQVRLTHTVLRDAEGRTTGDVIMVRDLDRERAATSLKEDFVARVSHELRTPLSPIRGYAQVLLRSIGRIDEAQQRKVFEQIIERVDHLEALIDDLLLVSRISSGSLEEVAEIDETVVDLSVLAARLHEWFVRDRPEREFALEQGDGWQLARGDELRIGQILTNLLSNACKYSPVDAPVVIRLERDGDTALVRVEDHGRGIARDQLEDVFERFHRLEDPQRMRTSGLGLGLYISRHLARRMGGDLTVESEPGRGSTFTLSLPAADEPPVARSGGRDARRRRPPAGGMRGQSAREPAARTD